ncbi:hypothetical protein [Lelliottia wanjuensis]|uniref:hypothetical protein n=1 Tax=Lelliottia wanjuensis TaxID=3050585 RepID=UPI00254F9AA5|nr:hypothetical protein [Lelliottia sp. V86_10]MDK9585786.1 hypothetical protein [Lelliottia sp. V86_10]
MASNIIKQINVKATFPSGRVVSGSTNVLSGGVGEPFQVWIKKGDTNSIIINPKFAETVEIEIEYEK